MRSERELMIARVARPSRVSRSPGSRVRGVELMADSSIPGYLEAKAACVEAGARACRGAASSTGWGRARG